MNKTISEFTEVELKAIKSDLYETIAKCQNDLAVINSELENRVKEQQAKTDATSEVTGTIKSVEEMDEESKNTKSKSSTDK